jgi:hypothetical protein
MKIKQLSVFMENKPGHLRQVCADLAEAGINIVTLSLADTSEFGILRLIIREWEKARAVLQEAGHTVNATDVMAIEVQDRPGGMQSVLAIAETAGVGIDYMYAFTIKEADKALLVIRFDDLERAAAALSTAGVPVLEPNSFYGAT